MKKIRDSKRVLGHFKRFLRCLLSLNVATIWRQEHIQQQNNWVELILDNSKPTGLYEKSFVVAVRHVKFDRTCMSLKFKNNLLRF